MDAKRLISAGLTKNQSEVFLYVLKNPECSGGDIAKAVSLDRSFVYGILNSLINKGLISYITKEKVRVYFSANPETLLKDIDEKRNKINEVVQELKSLKTQRKSERNISVYEGKAGLKTYIRDFLESDSFQTIGGGGNLNIFELLKYDFPHYLNDLKHKKIKGKIITSKKNEVALSKIYTNSKVLIKTLKSLDGDVSFTMFNNKLAIYSVEEKPFVVVIENEKVANSLRNYFEETWKLINHS